MCYIRTPGREEKHIGQKPALSPPLSNESPAVKEGAGGAGLSLGPSAPRRAHTLSSPNTVSPYFSSLQTEQTLPIMTSIFRSHLSGNNQLASEEGHTFCCCHTKLMTSFPHAEWRRPECHWMRCFCGVTTVGGQQDAQAAFRKHSHWLLFSLLFSFFSAPEGQRASWQRTTFSCHGNKRVGCL